MAKKLTFHAPPEFVKLRAISFQKLTSPRPCGERVRVRGRTAYTLHQPSPLRREREQELRNTFSIDALREGKSQVLAKKIVR
ncbi:hypothetical protein C5Y96_12745 [Blastopirellula marina]|uniref:Uncharacterized protein n=1 Tax=Blastopirellula marina TaxID=124 RepID=A0A2S8FGA4_9BACT|nr:hypothetical protein C5Y96_12745 [Blastopirellula marina]RCS51602.1 hypothetical protein DTL36_12755 [Bremerella cremea]